VIAPESAARLRLKIFIYAEERVPWASSKVRPSVKWVVRAAPRAFSLRKVARRDHQ